MHKILFLSVESMDGPLVLSSHSLAQTMARMGHEVAYVSTPITAAHLALMKQESGGAQYKARIANWWRSGAFAATNLYNYVPFALLPWPLARILVERWGKNPYWVCLPSIRSVLRRVGFSSVDILYIDQPRFAGLERIIDPRVTIYRATDFYDELVHDPAMGVVERRLARSVDALVGTSKPVIERLREVAPEKSSLVLTHGVDYEHFSKATSSPPEYHKIGRPRLVYVGQFDWRFDAAAIQILAQQIPHGNIILIGPHNQHIAQLFVSSPNVHLLGARTYERLPAYLQHSDVGLLPLSNHPSNAGRNPIKLFQYAAAGLTVVARETAVLAKGQMPFVRTYNTQEELGAVVARTLSSKIDPLVVQAQVASESWNSKADMLLRFTENVLSAKAYERE